MLFLWMMRFPAMRRHFLSRCFVSRVDIDHIACILEYEYESDNNSVSNQHPLNFPLHSAHFPCVRMCVCEGSYQAMETESG